MPPISVNIYCDESFDRPIHDSTIVQDEIWTYLGLLIVPENIDHALQAELSQPLLNGFEDARVHFKEAGSGPVFRLSKAWLDFLISQNLANQGLVYFYILGINQMRLNMERFGPPPISHRAQNMYNRFFRTALKRSLKYFFNGYDHINVQAIYHDETPAAQHPFFPWHSIAHLNRLDPKINVVLPRINFLCSDHRSPHSNQTAARYLQFIDLILGTSCNCLHNASENANKVSLTETIYPLTSRLIPTHYVM